MAFQQQVIGLKDLERNLRAIANLVPGGELADSLADGAWVVAFQAKQNALTQGLFDTGALVDSIAPRKVNQYRVDVQVGVVYGAIHEFGGTFTVTERQRRFFWAKHMETKDGMWRALALSATYTMPAKPYLRPAIDSTKREAIQVTARSLYDKIRRVVT